MPAIFYIEILRHILNYIGKFKGPKELGLTLPDLKTYYFRGHQ